MVMNELIFFIYLLATSLSLLIALLLGKEALVALVSLQLVLANLFVIKQITLVGFTVTSSDALAVSITLGMNLIQEYYGKQSVLRAIAISFFCMLFFTITSLLHVAYLPSVEDKAHACFSLILSPMPRLIIASLVTYLIVQLLDSWLYGALKKIVHDRFFIFRNYVSISITQFVDTVLFSFLGLYGIIEHLGDVIVLSYAVKLATLIIAVPFLALSRWMTKTIFKKKL